MRKLSILGAIAILMLAATMTVAASPSPSPSASPAPSATPASTATPATTGTGSGSPSATTTAAAVEPSAVIHPIHNVWGVAKVHELADGNADLNLHLHGLRADDQWTAVVQGGTIEKPNGDQIIATLSGPDVSANGTDVLTVKLDKDQLHAFRRDRKSDGVVVFLTDGTRQSAAEFPAD